MVSISQFRSRVHGRDGSEDWESSSTGSTGGGGVILDEAGTAETILVRSRRTKKKCIMGFIDNQSWGVRGGRGVKRVAYLVRLKG